MNKKTLEDILREHNLGHGFLDYNPITKRISLDWEWTAIELQEIVDLMKKFEGYDDDERFNEA